MPVKVKEMLKNCELLQKLRNEGFIFRKIWFKMLSKSLNCPFGVIATDFSLQLTLEMS